MTVKKRIIPVLLVKNGHLVRSEGMSLHQCIGNVSDHTQRLRDWDCDEIMVIDITNGSDHDIGRTDTAATPYATRHEMVKAVAAMCRMPLSFGGGITTFDEVRILIRECGVERVAIRTALHLIPKIADMFGSQAVTAIIDYRGGWRDVSDRAQAAERLGAGEIWLHHTPSDGKACGFDYLQAGLTAQELTVPTVALGGAGSIDHFDTALREAPWVSGWAASNWFYFQERSYPRLKRALKQKGHHVRFNTATS